jgi:HSP20 family protein
MHGKRFVRELSAYSYESLVFLISFTDVFHTNDDYFKSVTFKKPFTERNFTMSNLTRWEPVREMMTLRDAMDRLFDDAFTRPIGTNGGSTTPAIDLYQTDEEVVLRAALPGLKADDVQISVTNNVLTLRGEFKWEDAHKEATYHIREQRYGSFERSIALPVDVQTDKAQADFQDGVLTITLPKAESLRPRTISIKAK